MLADRLQLMVLCQMGPVVTVHGSPQLLTRQPDCFTLAKKSSDISCPIPKFLQLQRCPKLCTAEILRWSSCLQRLWTAAKASGQDQGLQQATTEHGHFDSFKIIPLQDHISITVHMPVLHTDTLSLHSPPGTDYLVLCKVQNYADWIHYLVQYLPN